ncbi:MAG: gamma-glutamylcyclotransferase [Lentisphaeria bacterium]|nr:gamma-glutamylcyclotransferase [Lentisphaeria bacterium]
MAHPNHPDEQEAARIRANFKDIHEDHVDLFVYGTMMSDQHVRLLLNRTVDSEPAVLHNYMRVVPPGAFYFVVKQHGAVASGRLLKDLSPEELERLDAFEDEGNLYFRRKVVVRTEDNRRRRCMTYVGNIPALQRSFGREILFEDRYSLYLERKIDQILQTIDPGQRDITRRALRELMGSAVDSLIESHFDGNYICNYIMVQAFNDAKPPLLADILQREDLRPYADNYMKLACKHIIFNQFVELIRHHFPNAVRLSKKYFRHGLAVLLGFLYYNRHSARIEAMMKEKALDRIVPGRLYQDYAVLCINLVEEVYCKEEMRGICNYVESHWYSTPTPLGAELEFSYLGARAVVGEPGEDPYFDGFYWFNDFDLQRRTWRMGGHVDAHRDIVAGAERHRGFFEYAFGRFNIVGDLSLPLFDCPWGMSKLINEAVRFLGIPPHSLHISMELPRHKLPYDALNRHEESDLVCLLMLGGDLRKDENGRLREWRIFNGELDTNMMDSLNFSSRKYHYSRPDQSQNEAADVMEYKFMRLRSEETDYSNIIMALKGYQFGAHPRPLSIPPKGESELPEQTFMRRWAADPVPIRRDEIYSFLDKVERGIKEEYQSTELGRRRRAAMDNIAFLLFEKNAWIERNRRPEPENGSSGQPG